jgi:hypothetical protein
MKKRLRSRERMRRRLRQWEGGEVVSGLTRSEVGER